MLPPGFGLVWAGIYNPPLPLLLATPSLPYLIMNVTSPPRQDSIAPQFGPFRRGFLRLCSGAALGWFSASELELLVCGSRALRLTELEAATQYEDGYTRDSEVGGGGGGEGGRGRGREDYECSG